MGGRLFVETPASRHCNSFAERALGIRAFEPSET